MATPICWSTFRCQCSRSTEVCQWLTPSPIWAVLETTLRGCVVTPKSAITSYVFSVFTPNPLLEKFPDNRNWRWSYHLSHQISFGILFKCGHYKSYIPNDNQLCFDERSILNIVKNFMCLKQKTPCLVSDRGFLYFRKNVYITFAFDIVYPVPFRHRLWLDNSA